jgi:hypothetical protein
MSSKELFNPFSTTRNPVSANRAKQAGDDDSSNSVPSINRKYDPTFISHSGLHNACRGNRANLLIRLGFPAMEQDTLPSNGQHSTEKWI